MVVGFDYFDLVGHTAPELEFVILPLAAKWDLPPVPFVIPKRKIYLTFYISKYTRGMQVLFLSK